MGASMTPRMFHNVYPICPQMVPYPYLPQQHSSGVVSLPYSMPMTATTAGSAPAAAVATTTTTTAAIEMGERIQVLHEFPRNLLKRNHQVNPC
ncbi:hypothetical protein F3Y22_tig00110467pilonHSYRG00161 [Hibiscus syriacus]|uniref:Uncharacterized protein n=2 Tax=Hibiscus syriacus TaxID=106335 RepID=A0A6A3AJ53_HIBSY|nr:hypothetical protein F3Y22_tig00110467pilonHSYRG00161 [Hibiscus syriacus]